MAITYRPKIRKMQSVLMMLGVFRCRQFEKLDFWAAASFSNRLF